MNKIQTPKEQRHIDEYTLIINGNYVFDSPRYPG